ncbi:MAG: tetratricopeptide repeat protein [Actinomycetota bacterium]|nr:tetratricopeptide repeat protein [Rubrobacteraceae bacterium]MDQ3430182.1 tetratricopeptide repeat protein [Actinomycetota bacterium]
MGSAAVPVVLIFLIVVFSGVTIYSGNRDLARAKAWGDLARRFLPFVVLALMAVSLYFVRTFAEGWVTLAWIVLFGVLIVASSLFSVPALERRANGVFRRGDYPQAAELYEKLVEERPLARNHAFRGAALGASERYDESINASTKAIDMDPEYGLAYYNRALVLRRTGKKSRAVQDLNKALEADLPRRFRSASKKILQDLA